MNSKSDHLTAQYFGLRVEVIYKMEQCSLISFEGRRFIVDTKDLVFERGLAAAA